MNQAWLDAYERWSGTRERSSASDAFKAGWDAFADPGVPVLDAVPQAPDLATHLLALRINRARGTAMVALDARNPEAVGRALRLVAELRPDAVTIFARREDLDDGSQGNWLEEGLCSLEVPGDSGATKRSGVGAGDQGHPAQPGN